MRIMIMFGVAISAAIVVFGQTGGNRQSTNGSPTGTRGGFTERTRTTSSPVIFRKTAQLIHLTPDELASEYSADAATCAVPPKSYLVLRMAAMDYKLDRQRVLEAMCSAKTTSVSKALSTSKSHTGVTPAFNAPADLKSKEREYLAQIDAAAKQ